MEHFYVTLSVKHSLCRELTKLNEETHRTTLGGAIAYYTEHEPRGEYVLVLMGEAEYGGNGSADSSPLSALSPDEHVAHYLGSGLSRMDAIKAAARDRGMSKSELYALLCKE